jgi:hypothetical protein
VDAIPLFVLALTVLWCTLHLRDGMTKFDNHFHDEMRLLRYSVDKFENTTDNLATVIERLRDVLEHRDI